MKLITAKEGFLVSGGCWGNQTTGSDTGVEIDDWFIDDVIAKSLSNSLNTIVRSGGSDAQLSRYWNKYVEQYNVNPYLYGRIMTYFETSLIKPGPY